MFLALLLLTCEKPPVHPNVLLITLDSFRADRITRRTPNLSALARSGVNFTQADSAVPLTLPSHATILSGLLPLHHGLRNDGAGVLSRDTLATAFSNAGYRTAAFVSAFVLDHRFGLNAGFDTYDDEVARDPNDTGGTFEAERRGEATVDRALTWLRTPDTRPWFAWVHLYDAHAPYAPPAPFKPTYDGEVAYVDQQVGRLLAAVDRKTTAIIVVGDHGESLGEHGELTHGLLIYESTLHVPFIVAAPGERARHVDDPVSTADVAPTVASLAGLTLRGDGENVLRSRAARNIYAETQYPATFGWTALTSLRSGSVKIIDGARSELFHLPNEKTNVATSDRRAYNTLSRSLADLGNTAVQTAQGPLDDEARSKLASLGYIAPANVPATNEDPRDMAPLFSQFERANRSLDADALEQLVHRDPANAVFRSSLAHAYRDRGDLDRAIVLYRDAAGIAPRDADAWYNLASALHDAGRSSDATAAVSEAEELDPNRADIYNLIGVLRMEAGDAAGAEANFRKAIALDPRDPRSYNDLGNVLRLTGRLSDAEAAFRQALAIAPSFYEAQLNRAIALQMAGKNREASDALKKFLVALPRQGRYDAQRTAATTLLARLKSGPPGQ